MAKFKPLPTGVVHTMQTIIERCEEEGDCLIWQAGKSHGTPALRHDGRIMQVRRYIFEVLQGQVVPEGMLISFNCDNPTCVFEGHIHLYTRQELQTYTAKRTKYGANPVHAMRMARLKQAASNMTWETVHAIRAMEGSDKGIARALGLKPSLVNCIRKHRTWRESNPFSGLIKSN